YCLVCACFCHATPPTDIYTLSLHDALPISCGRRARRAPRSPGGRAVAAAVRRHLRRGSRSLSPSAARSAAAAGASPGGRRPAGRSEEHTSELQSRGHLVCRLLLEKKNNT